MHVQRSEYEAWTALCVWLEAQPYNAAYRVPDAVPSYLLLSARDFPKHRVGAVRYAQYQRNDQIRKAYNLVYWASGYGWRLRRFYRKELARMAEQIIPDPVEEPTHAEVDE